MELYQLRQFAAVAKYENMTRAAESLNVAQPAVSKTIRNLESELGAELFERTGRDCATEQGRYPAAVRTDDTGSRARRTRRN